MTRDMGHDLRDVRERDAATNEMWFVGPPSFTALAARDRRALLREVDALHMDALRWRQVREWCGHFGDGSDTQVVLSPDDATRSWGIRIGRNTCLGTDGSTLEGLIDQAIIDAAIAGVVGDGT
jgi:hypothetical protein